MAEKGPSPLEQLSEVLSGDLERIERELKETTAMIAQSRGEVDRLAQRNAAMAAQLRQVQADAENLSRAEIIKLYEQSQDSLQRLFAMRGQLERLQSDQAGLERLREQVRKTQQSAAASRDQEQQSAAASLSGKAMVVRIIEAQELERQRLSRQIHDGPAQAMSNFILQTEIAVRLFDVDRDRAKAEMAAMKTSASSTFQKIRDFIFELRPMMLDDLGLVPTIKRYVDAYKAKGDIQVTLKITGAVEKRLESVREVVIFRSLQELLSNVREHAQATQVRVAVDIDDRRVRAEVEDNGQGFDASALEAGEPGASIGLSALKERVEMLGGQMHVDSQAGQGTRVVMEVPVEGG